MPRPILISISPNSNFKQFFLALKTLIAPWQWLQGKTLVKLKTSLAAYFKAPQVYLVNAGRSGLYLSLKSLDLNEGDEVLCQAFTCVAVPNSIIATSGKPVYVDTVQNSFNLSVKDLQRKISPKTKALIVQHTFGLPDDLDAISKICKKNKITLIEDCAHSLGAEYQGKPVGSFGDLAVLSFGRDKVISSVFGGAIVVNNQSLAQGIKDQYQNLKFPNTIFVFKQLIHPIIFFVLTPLYFWPHYRFSLGKVGVWFFQRLGLITMPVSKKDKQCLPDLAPAKLPNGLALLALSQWQDLAKMNLKRIKVAREYQSLLKNLSKQYPFQLTTIKPGQIFLRYPVLTQNPQALIDNLKTKGVMLGNWYRPVISPSGVNLKATGYESGSCPHAEAISHTIINLPTHSKMSSKDIKRVVKLIKVYVRNKTNQ